MAHQKSQKSHNPSQDAINTFCVSFVGASSGRIPQPGSTAVSGLEINPILYVPVSFLPPRRMCLCRRRCWSHRRRTAHEKIFLIFMAFSCYAESFMDFYIHCSCHNGRSLHCGERQKFPINFIQRCITCMGLINGIEGGGCGWKHFLATFTLLKRFLLLPNRREYPRRCSAVWSHYR